MKKFNGVSSGVVWGMNLSFICLIEILFVVPFNWAIWGLEDYWRSIDYRMLVHGKYWGIYGVSLWKYKNKGWSKF